MSKDKNQNQKPAAKVEASALKFAPSTFGQKKALPATQERIAALREFHTSLVTTDAQGTPVYPSKTAFVVAAHKAGYTTREIAETLGMKPAVVYSMIWRVTSGYKPPRKGANGSKEAAAGEVEAPPEGDDELTDEEVAELEEEDLGEGAGADL